MKQKEDCLTGRELRSILKCSRKTIYNYRKQGMPVEIGRRGMIRYNLTNVKAWLNQKNDKES